MPLLRKGVLIPIKGIDFSKPATFIDDRNGFPTNMRYYRSELRKRPGKTVQGGVTNDGSQVMGLGRLELSSGSKHLVRASKRHIERLNTSTGLWEVISIITYNSGDEDFFSFTTVTEDGLLISTNYIDAPYRWPGSGNQVLLGGSPPKAKYAAYLSPYTLLAYTNDGTSVEPWRVAWSDTNNPNAWSGGNSGEALLSDEPSVIQNIANLNEFIAAYKKDSLYLGRKVDPPDIFIFERIKTGIGLGAPRAFADAEGQHYFMGANDFFVWNGIRVDSIGESVRDEVFSRINREKINRCFAVHVQELNEVWFFVVIAGNSWPTEVWKYQYRLGFWYFDTCDQLTAAIKWERINTVAWNDATGTWDQAQSVWDASATVADWEDIMFGASDGFCAKLDYTTTNDRGTAVSSSFITKDFVADTLEKNKRWLRFDVWGRGPGKLYVDYSTDFGSNWTNIPYTSSQQYVDLTSVSRKYEFYLDIWAEQIRFRLRNAESSETIYITNLYPYYLDQEEVQTYR